MADETEEIVAETQQEEQVESQVDLDQVDPAAKES